MQQSVVHKRVFVQPAPSALGGANNVGDFKIGKIVQHQKCLKIINNAEGQLPYGDVGGY